MTVVLTHEIHGYGCCNTQNTQYSEKAFSVHIYIVLHKVSVLQFKCNSLSNDQSVEKKPTGIAYQGK